MVLLKTVFDKQVQNTVNFQSNLRSTVVHVSCVDKSRDFQKILNS